MKNYLPRILKEEKLIEKYFGHSFLKMFNHDFFKWEVENYRFDYSQVYGEFIKNTAYSDCASTVSAFESNFQGKENMSNPVIHRYKDKVINMMNGKFGEGYYDKKFGRADYGNRNAIPWDLDTLK